MSLVQVGLVAWLAFNLGALAGYLANGEKGVGWDWLTDVLLWSWVGCLGSAFLVAVL